jgi:hypothetical protein
MHGRLSTIGALKTIAFVSNASAIGNGRPMRWSPRNWGRLRSTMAEVAWLSLQRSAK